MDSTAPLDILVLAYRRPDLLLSCIANLEKYPSARLWIVVDGPQDSSVVNPVSECALIARSAAGRTGGHCLIREENLGSGLGVVSALDWFFANVPFGVVVEDDCIIEPGFLASCAALSDVRQAYPDIWMISGSNRFVSWFTRSDFFVARTCWTWGWATWADRWRQYEYELSDSVILETSTLKQLASHYGIFRHFYVDYFKEVASGSRPSVWDYQWQFLVACNGGLSLVPRRNLVRNVGTGSGATHTSNSIPIGARRAYSSRGGTDVSSLKAVSMAYDFGVRSVEWLGRCTRSVKTNLKQRLREVT